MKIIHNLIIILITFSCSSAVYRKSEISSSVELNETPPTVILISIDGYRHDYTKIYNPDFLTKIHHQGVRAELKPIFPSYTFPNHYSIITGLYAENHGILANGFYDPTMEKTYSLRDRESMANPDWYLGEPLWVTAEKQGITTACHYWVGCEAKIQGIYPSFNEPYSQLKPNHERVNTVINWLQRSKKNRPRFITLYFSSVDSAGHQYGPLSPQVREAINNVDQSIKKLVSYADSLEDNINIIIVSDHGMEDLRKKKIIHLSDEIKSESLKFKFIGSGPMMMIYNTYGGDEKILLKHLRKQSRYFKTYTRKSIPHKYRFKKSHRAPDILLVADKRYLIKKPKSARSSRPMPIGSHGYDPARLKSMRGIFYAYGPLFKEKYKISPFENIHIHPLITHMLGIESNKVDGKLNILKKILKKYKTKK